MSSRISGRATGFALACCCSLSPLLAFDASAGDDIEGMVREVAAATGTGAGHGLGEHVTYAYAQVLHVDPVFEEVKSRDCRPNHSESPDGADRGEEGEHDPEAAAAQDESRDCLFADAFVPERQLVGYDVGYRYRGEVFLSRLSRHPGDRLRIRVAVSPAEADNDTATGGGRLTPTSGGITTLAY